MRETAFFLWAVALIVELFWVYNMTHNVHSDSDLFYAGVVVFVTVSVGFVGALLFRNRGNV